MKRNTGPTPFWFEVKHKLDTDIARLRRDWIEHWLLKWHDPDGFSAKDCRGGTVSSRGIQYDDQKRWIFWDGIGPCVDDVIQESFDLLRPHLKDLSPVTRQRTVQQVAGLLRGFVRQVYQEASDTDRALRGGGFPRSVPAEDPNPRIEMKFEAIDRQANAIIRDYPLNWIVKAGDWLQRHKVSPLIATIIGLFTIGGLGVAILQHFGAL